MNIEQTQEGRFLIDDQRQQKIKYAVADLNQQLLKLPPILQAHDWACDAGTLRGILDGGVEYIKQKTISDTENALLKAGVFKEAVQRFARESVQDIPSDMLEDIKTWRQDWVYSLNNMTVCKAPKIEDIDFKKGYMALSKEYQERMLDNCRRLITGEEEKLIVELRAAVQGLLKIGDAGYLVSDFYMNDLRTGMPFLQPGLIASLLGAPNSRPELTDVFMLEQLRKFRRAAQTQNQK